MYPDHLHHPFVRMLYHLRHYILNAPAQVILTLDVLIASIMTLYTIVYNRMMLQEARIEDYGAYGMLIDFAISFFVFHHAQVYKTMVRFTTMKDLLKLTAAVFVSCFLTSIVFIILQPEYYLAYLGSMIVNFMLSALCIIGYRIVCIGGRKWFEGSNTNVSISSLKSTRQRVVIVGDLDICIQKANLIQQIKGNEYEVVGYLTFDEASDKRKIGDLTCFTIRRESDLDDAMKYFQTSTLVLVGTSEYIGDKKLADICLSKGYQLRISHDQLSPFQEYSGLSVEEVQIEDLLSRPEIAIDKALIDEGIRDMVVMVTGAAGSIGSELVRQICPYRPRRIILLDHAETPLWLIRQEIERTFPNVPLATSITNVSHRRQLDLCFRKYRPEIIFHAAAYKHVPLMEENPCVAVVNNLKGSMHTATMAVKYRVKRFVMVSTDKAVNPTSVMGATKRLAEIFVQSLGDALQKEEGDTATVFITTRFGNVLGSAGSVIPLFKEQIKRGGPVTVTHPDIIRYFMTIPEACRLILQANAMGRSGEVFVFDMGKQVKIIDLAKSMIQLSGLTPLKDIAIEFTGLRPGEKLYEEPLTDLEKTSETAHERIRISQTKKYDMSALKPLLDALILQAESNNLEETIRIMKQLIPEYKSNNSPYQLYDTVEPLSPLLQ